METSKETRETKVTLRDIYQSIEDDLNALRSGRLTVADARVTLIARKTQLRTVEVMLAARRLSVQYRKLVAKR